MLFEEQIGRRAIECWSLGSKIVGFWRSDDVNDKQYELQHIYNLSSHANACGGQVSG
jgi:hypothetical protein